MIWDVFTRESALVRWRAFLPKAERYAAVRNGVSVSLTEVSQLSAAIRCRLLTEDEITSETLAAHSFPAAEKWLQEVWWRRYWKGWLEQRPEVWRSWRREVARLRREGSAAVLKRAEEVAAGRSGVAVMDGFARQLVETGYLHNHARMWWASFWIHVERLPWELGADFFFRHLVDADAASNTLSWRWVAGLQTRGKAYLVRRSNLERFCAPELLVDETGLERLEDGRVSAAGLPEEQSWEIVNPAVGAVSLAEIELPERWGFWIHEEDLCVEASGLVTAKPAAFAAMGVVGEAGDSGWRNGLWQAGIGDAGERMGGAAQVENVGDAGGLLAWALRERLTAVVAVRPFVGRLRDAVVAMEGEFAVAGIRLLWLRRASDGELLPLARKGFFPFWEGVRGRLMEGAQR